jgi:hypothetical protein
MRDVTSIAPLRRCGKYVTSGLRARVYFASTALARWERPRVVSVVYNNHPPSVLSATCLLLDHSPWQLQPVCDVSIRFLELSAGAGVHLEDERARACIADAVGVLDGELRLRAVC